MTRDRIQAMVVEGLISTFRLEADRIQPQARLYDDLDIDSIDAVDLAARLQQETGLRLSPETFKAVRTVDDLVDALATLLADRPDAAAPAPLDAASRP